MLPFFCVVQILTSKRVTVPRWVIFWNEVLRWLIVLNGWVISEVRFLRKTKRKSMEKAAIWHRCEEEAPAGLIHPKDVCLPEIVLLGGQQTETVQEVSGGRRWMMHYQAFVDVCVSKLKNKCNGERVCYVWLYCCSHQPIWQGKEGIQGAAVTHSLLAAGRTWETSPAFFMKILVCTCIMWW